MTDYCEAERPPRKVICQKEAPHEMPHRAVIFWEDETNPEVVRTESTPDEAYLDRNLAVQVLAVLAKQNGYQTGIRNREDEWPILYVDLPSGQVSWHISKNEIAASFPDYPVEWDGHDLEKKRDRLRQFLEAQ